LPLLPLTIGDPDEHLDLHAAGRDRTSRRIGGIVIPVRGVCRMRGTMIKLPHLLALAHRPARAMALLAGVLALATTATAQLVIAPSGMFVTAPGNSNFTWRSTPFRFQTIYSRQILIDQGVTGPVTIQRIRWRASDNQVSSGGIYAGVNVSIGTSANSYQFPSDNFGNNRFTVQNVLTNGVVPVAPATGASPNTYVIDIPIPGGFVYNPLAGRDLLIEVDAPAPAGQIPGMATSTNAATDRAVRISEGDRTSPVGLISGFASVVMLDIAGGPGGIASIQLGAVTPYGTGCAPTPSSGFAEQLGTNVANLDLGAGITLVPSVPGAPQDYTVQAGAGAFLPPTGSPVLANTTPASPMDDDSVSQPLQLTSFSFPHPGGTTNVLHATSNGYLLLGPTTATNSDFNPSLADLSGGTTAVHAGAARLCPIWYDLHASRNLTVNPAAGIYFREDVLQGTATITWFDVGEYATSAPGVARFRFQVVLSSTGSVQFRYGTMSPFHATPGSALGEKQVGYFSGIQGVQVPSRDLSATMPFATSIAAQPLVLSAGPAPILGGSTTLVTANVPLPGVSLTFLGFGQINPGLDLVILGMPGCFAYTTLDLNVVLVGTGSVSTPVPIPNVASLTGAQIFAQTLSLDASQPNAFGARTSNGVALTVGNVQ
jgi:hypothetical protein